jgi:hypothetical protein
MMTILELRLVVAAVLARALVLDEITMARLCPCGHIMYTHQED